MNPSQDQTQIEARLQGMVQPGAAITRLLEDDGTYPNNRKLPLVVATRGADKSSTYFRWTQYEARLERLGARIEHLFKPQITRAPDWHMI